MATLEQQLADAIASQNALTQAVASYKSQLDSTVAAQKAAYDAWRAGARDEILVMRRQALNTAVIDKAFFKLDDPANFDSAADKSATKWKAIGISQVYGAEGCLVNVDTDCCSSVYGGYWETPVQYATDRSTSKWQFVLANFDATSDQINARIKTSGLKIPDFGNWSDDSQILRTTCVQVVGRSAYCRLFVRLVNRLVIDPTLSIDGWLPQDVSKFGGGSVLRARVAEIYPNIRF